MGGARGKGASATGCCDLWPLPRPEQWLLKVFLHQTHFPDAAAARVSPGQPMWEQGAPTHPLSSPTQHLHLPSTPTSTQTSSFPNRLYGPIARQLGQMISPIGDGTWCSEQGSQWLWEPHHDFASKSAVLFLIPSSLLPLLFLVKWPPRATST